MLHHNLLYCNDILDFFASLALFAGLVGLDIYCQNIATRFRAKIAHQISAYIDSKFAATRLG